MRDVKNKWNRNPIHSAVVHAHLDIIKFFISDQNCDPNIPGQYGGTLLHYAAVRVWSSAHSQVFD